MIKITKKGNSVNAVAALTPSKSITNRVLIIKSLCENDISILNAANSDDSIVLASALSQLSPVVNVNDSGSAYRFLTAFLSIQPGTFTLTGSERMKMRPVGRLVRALRNLGAQIDFIENDNYPPLRISGRQLKGGSVSIDASESSQFVSALLLIAPSLLNGMKLELTGKINSRPYIIMTLSLMQYFGIKIKTEGSFISVAHQKYVAQNIRVENDWSSASFWFLIAALSHQAEIVLKGLYRNSIQGDSIVVSLMQRFGIQSDISGDNIILVRNPDAVVPGVFEYDFSACPDLVIPIAVLCAARGVAAQFKGVKNLRLKESDRLMALKTELEKTGVEVLLSDDSFTLHGRMNASGKISFHSHNDHRMVMALAPLALLFDEVVIDDHLPVNKSYPEFWEQFASAGFNCTVS